MELRKSIPAAEKMAHPAAGSSLVGRGIRLLWRLILIVSLAPSGIADPCSKCVQNVKYGGKTFQSVAVQSHINAGEIRNLLIWRSRVLGSKKSGMGGYTRGAYKAVLQQKIIFVLLREEGGGIQIMEEYKTSIRKN